MALSAGRSCLFASALVLASCGGGADGPRLRIGVSPTPPTVGGARIIVGLPPELATVDQVRVTARPHDSQSGDTAVAERSGPEAFAVPSFPFDRAGAWRIVAEATTPAGTVLRDSLDVRVVGTR